MPNAVMLLQIFDKPVYGTSNIHRLKLISPWRTLFLHHYGIVCPHTLVSCFLHGQSIVDIISRDSRIHLNHGNRQGSPFSNEKRHVSEVTSDGCNIGLKASLVGVRTPGRFFIGKDKVICTFGLETWIPSCAPKGKQTEHLKLTRRVVMILNSPRVCEGWVKRRKPLRSLYTVLI